MSLGKEFEIKDFCETYFQAERNALTLANGRICFTEEDKVVINEKLSSLFNLRRVLGISAIASILVGYGGGTHGRHYGRLTTIYKSSPQTTEAPAPQVVVEVKDVMVGFKANLLHSLKSTCSAGIKQGLSESQLLSLFKDAYGESKAEFTRSQQAAKIEALLRDTGLTPEELVEVLESY